MGNRLHKIIGGLDLLFCQIGVPSLVSKLYQDRRKYNCGAKSR